MARRVGRGTGPPGPPGLSALLPLGVSLLLLWAASGAAGATLSSASFKTDVAPAVAGEASGGGFRVCAGTGCLAVPAAASVPPANRAAPGGGGGGGGETAPAPAPEVLPVLETATLPAPKAETPTPAPTAAPPAFAPPLPLDDRTPAPSSGRPIPGPLVAVAAAGTLAALLLLRGVAGRTPGAAEEGEVAVAPRTEVIGGNCPFCGDLIKGRGLILPCPSCKAVHHPECWAQNGGCTTLGCPKAPSRPGTAEAEE